MSIFVPVPLPPSDHKHGGSAQEFQQSFFKSNIHMLLYWKYISHKGKEREGGSWSLAITSQMPHISSLAASTEKFEKKEKVWCKNIKRNNARYLGSLLALRIPVKTKEGLLKSLYNWFHPEVTQGNHLPHQKRTLKPCVKRACFCAVLLLHSPCHLFYWTFHLWVWITVKWGKAE